MCGRQRFQVCPPLLLSKVWARQHINLEAGHNATVCEIRPFKRRKKKDMDQHVKAAISSSLPAQLLSPTHHKAPSPRKGQASCFCKTHVRQCCSTLQLQFLRFCNRPDDDNTTTISHNTRGTVEKRNAEQTVNVVPPLVEALDPRISTVRRLTVQQFSTKRAKHCATTTQKQRNETGWSFHSQQKL